MKCKDTQAHDHGYGASEVRVDGACRARLRSLQVDGACEQRMEHWVNTLQSVMLINPLAPL
eukprot:1289818-Prymnesium_polylepis.1